MSENIYRPGQSLDALRIRAEIETAGRATTKRPTWAPAVVLDGELLELCREAEFLALDDKPIARLWALFPDPKRQGAVIRSTFSKHELEGVRCRGFEMHAGESHSGGRMTNALMNYDGAWSVGHVSRGHDDLGRMRRNESWYQGHIKDIAQRLEPDRPLELKSAAEIEQRLQEKGYAPERFAQIVESRLADQAEALERWEKREAEKRDPAFIERQRVSTQTTQKRLEEQRDITKEEAAPDWRYRAKTRITELATQRLMQFVGDPEAERRRGAEVSGACFCCGKTLTDPISVELGIGPECPRYLRVFDWTDLVKLKNEMVESHPDRGGTHEKFLSAFAKYSAARQAAESSVAF